MIACDCLDSVTVVSSELIDSFDLLGPSSQIFFVRDHQGLCRGLLLHQNHSNSHWILLGIVNVLHHAMIEDPPMVA